jgi:hypothetical protein
MARVTTSWDITKGLPDKNCWHCNANGASKPNGKYIAWVMAGATKTTPDIIRCTVPGGLLTAQKCYIAKIHIPYIRESCFDYEKFRTTPVDLVDKKNRRKIDRKISRILQNLGVAYADRAGLLKASNETPTTAWVTDKNGREAILINPWILLKHNMSVLVRLVKKEVIHRALFRNLSELSNKIILNFTLDVLSMRVIAQTPAERLDKQTVRLSERLFNPRIYKKFPLLALTDCSLTNHQAKRNLPLAIYEIWAELYGGDRYGNLPSLKRIKPSTLYFKIKSLIDEIVIGGVSKGAGEKGTETNYPWNVKPGESDGKGNTKNDADVAGEFDKKNEKFNDAVKQSFVPKRFRNSKWYSNSASNFWDEQIIQKKDFVNDTLKEFAKKWRTEKMLEDVEGKLRQIMGNDEVEVQPYPEELTDNGVIMMAIGISEAMGGIYWNKDDSESSNRKKVAAFFDLSPSMTHLFPYMIRVVESVEEQCDVTFSRNLPKEQGGGTAKGAYGFAGSVTELDEDDLQAMKDGKLKAGNATCFNAILEHIFTKIEEESIDIILCFTDGYSSLSQENIDKFNETGRQFFNIYMTEYHGAGSDRTNVTSDLDNLNGESFTLCLPPVDSNRY